MPEISKKVDNEPSLRLFVAISLPAPFRRKLWHTSSLWRSALPRARWTVPEQYHCTVYFIGMVRGAITPVSMAVAEAVQCCSPFTLQSEAVTYFPDAKQPRLIALTFQSHPDFSKLAHSLHHALQSPEGNHIGERPHCTVARLREPVKPLRQPLGTFRKTVFVQSVDLLSSTLTPHGSRYRQLASFKLTH